MRKSSSQSRKKSSFLIMAVISLVVGFVFWIVGEMLFSFLTESLFTPIGISLYFLIFLCFVAVYGIVSNFVLNGSRRLKLVLKNAAKIFVILLCVFLLVTGLFEYLYEIEKSAVPDPTSYIFLIDDSGSMEGTEQDRIDAVNEMMKNSPLPFAVYKFSFQAERLKQMSRYTEQITGEQLEFKSEGGTEIIGSIRNVLDDFESGLLPGTGAYPRILLVSDGGSSRFGLNSIVGRCRKNGFTICTIGVQGCNASLLEKIAVRTGGGFVYCNNVSNLSEEMTRALATEADRNLLSERFVFERDTLYAVLRIVFLSLMGLMWSALKCTVLDRDVFSIKLFYLISSICCCVGAIIVELGAAEQSISFIRLIFVLSWALLPGSKIADKDNNQTATTELLPVAEKNEPQINPNVIRLDNMAGKPNINERPFRFDEAPPPIVKNSKTDSVSKPKSGPPSFN